MIARTFSALVLAALLVACANEEPDDGMREASSVTRLDEQSMPLESQDVMAVKAWLDSDRQPLPTATPKSALPSAPPVSDMIDGLETRLRDHPADVKGWALLAQSYAFVGKMDAATRAVDKAVALGADEAELRERIRQAHEAIASGG